MLLKGDGDQADHIAYGSTLSADGNATRQFDFMLANPPYGKSWKTDAEKMGGKKDILDSRFNAYLEDGTQLSMIPRTSDERLKNGGSVLTVEYFDRLLEQIREIRLSERRFYQKITDIYATALDYDRTAKTTKQFFAKVQNKMHYAVHGHTAAELIYERADADKPHMGLTTWAAAPEGKIVKSDVSIAKNYLSEKEMRSLERIVSAYLDLAEDRAERHIPMTMEDWAKRLDLFLMADDREVLQDAGKITAEIAKAKAETEFEKYRVIQDVSSHVETVVGLHRKDI